MVASCDAQAPAGPISFEGLYAKLLVYCHDMNLAPSTEGALEATEPDRLPRCACTRASQADATPRTLSRDNLRQLRYFDPFCQAKAALFENVFIHRTLRPKCCESQQRRLLQAC